MNAAAASAPPTRCALVKQTATVAQQHSSKRRDVIGSEVVCAKEGAQVNSSESQKGLCVTRLKSFSATQAVRKPHRAQMQLVHFVCAHNPKHASPPASRLHRFFSVVSLVIRAMRGVRCGTVRDAEQTWASVASKEVVCGAVQCSQSVSQ
jgi:hypothetical protein